MAQQSGGEFASADPTKGEENAGLRERGIRAKISLNACRRVQHLQRSTPSRFGTNAPGFSNRGYGYVAHGRCFNVTILVNEILRPVIRQRDNARARVIATTYRVRSLRVGKTRRAPSRKSQPSQSSSWFCRNFAAPEGIGVKRRSATATSLPHSSIASPSARIISRYAATTRRRMLNRTSFSLIGESRPRPAGGTSSFPRRPAGQFNQSPCL